MWCLAAKPSDFAEVFCSKSFFGGFLKWGDPHFSILGNVHSSPLEAIASPAWAYYILPFFLQAKKEDRIRVTQMTPADSGLF